jgi:hypothetical protein
MLTVMAGGLGSAVDGVVLGRGDDAEVGGDRRPACR